MEYLEIGFMFVVVVALFSLITQRDVTLLDLLFWYIGWPVKIAVIFVEKFWR